MSGNKVVRKNRAEYDIEETGSSLPVGVNVPLICEREAAILRSIVSTATTIAVTAVQPVNVVLCASGQPITITVSLSCLQLYLPR